MDSPLHHKEGRFLRDAPALFCVATLRDTRLLWVGGRWTPLLGWTRDELLATPYLDLVHPDDVPSVRASASAFAEPGGGIEGLTHRVRCRAGGWRHVMWRARLEDDLIHGIGTDVTALMQRVQSAEDRIAHLQMAEEMANVGHWRIDLQARTQRWSAQVFRIYGRDPALGPPSMDEAVAFYHPEDQAQLRALLDAAERDRRPYQFELRVRRPDGAERLVRSHGRPELNEEGEVIALLGVIQDVTDQRRMQQRLQDAERLSTISTLVAGIAHELNNPLQYLSCNVSLAMDGLDEVGEGAPRAWVAEQRSLLSDAEHAVGRVAGIIDDLRAFLRPPSDGATAPVDLREILVGAVRMSHSKLTAGARLRQDLGPLPQVMGERSEFIQVFLNLLLNAAEALEATEEREASISVRSHTDDRGWAVIDVEDNGPGIPDVVRSRIFDPFFTTKQVGQGTGLGLHVARGIVYRRGGDIAVESRPGCTRFRVTLPPAAASARPPAPALARPTLLVVDDDPQVAETLALLLRRAFSVTVSLDPMEALDRYQAGERFDLVVHDLRMRGMDGDELALRALEVWPELTERLVFITGADVDNLPLPLRAVPLLSKPFPVAALRDLLLDRLLAANHEVG